MRRLVAGLSLAFLAGCGASRSRASTGASAPTAAAPVARAPDASSVTITIVGTSDLHGHVESLPTLGGYVSILRELRGGEDGVLLVDAGDLFQGTLTSNLGEGAAVVKAYNALHYDAVAVGNHEFDFGPVGPNASVSAAGEEPRGALVARILESRFLWLSANVRNSRGEIFAKAGNLVPRTIVTKKGVRIGLVGVTSEDTLRTTLSANVSDLTISPIAKTIEEQATALRGAGADVVVALTHAGGKCQSFDHPEDSSSCAKGEELVRALESLPKGTVDAVVAGHTHQAISHQISGIPVIQSYANGRSFGRVDLVVRDRKLESVKVFPPHELSLRGTYEDRPIVAAAHVAQAYEADTLAADQKRKESLGVRLSAKFVRSYDYESAVGNLFADLSLRAVPKADVALANGGGLRADLPEGELTYGSLFEAMPFDNRVARVTMKASELEELLRKNLQGSHGILDVAGLFVTARCEGARLALEMRRAVNGKPGKIVNPDDTLVVVMSDFLATGGDGVVLPKERVAIGSDMIRDVLERELKKEKELDPVKSFDSKNPRLRAPTMRPVRCDAK